MGMFTNPYYWAKPKQLHLLQNWSSLFALVPVVVKLQDKYLGSVLVAAPLGGPPPLQKCTKVRSKGGPFLRTFVQFWRGPPPPPPKVYKSPE